MQDYEKLGVFYLGKAYDSNEKKLTDNLILYDSKDLTTHAVCVGMTGSGKTGLCISLLEEASVDNIPTIIIDPKGDMTNLLLSFPDLKPDDFLPWINKSDAETKGMSPQDYAAKQSELWKSGLEKWGQSGERIKRWKESANFAIYTPGSNAGLPISILKSFDAPSKELLEDSDLFSERISATVTGLLGLLGITADPLRSREHILLSNILKYYWEQGQNLNLEKLIQSVQSPPITKIGAFDVESFYPSKDRFDLAISLNNLLSAPGFQSWFEGEALDIDNLLFTPKGKPGVSIFYIAHLSDPERMFFVSMLLNQIISWMRKQSGTTSLRALLYFDEIFGYFPPTANPPSKKPMMTLLKQARAFGLGVVVATQNPVDLDYKALSNIGTWFIGRLQTERDRDRLLDGLEGATAEGGKAFNRKEISNIISNLDKRVFYLHNVHENKPEVFQTRWAMSYLAGPLSRTQVKELMQNYHPEESVAIKSSPTLMKPDLELSSIPPALPPDIKPLYIPVRGSDEPDSKLVYKPFLFGHADVHFSDLKKGIELEDSLRLLTQVTADIIPVNWEDASVIDLDTSDLSKAAESNGGFEVLPSSASDKKNYKEWEDKFKDHIFRNHKLELLKSPSLKETSKPLESERDFRIRIGQVSREQRDEWMIKLREKYSKQTASLESKIRTAEEKISREESQAQQQKLQTAINIGSTLLGAFLGRKTVSTSTVGRAGASMRSASRAMKESQDVKRAAENLEILKQQLADLEIKFQEEVDAYSEKLDISNEVFETVSMRPKKTDISVKLVNFVWAPYWKYDDNTSIPAWE